MVSFAATRSGGARASGSPGATLDRTFVGLGPNPSFPSGVGAAGGTTSAGSGRATVTIVPPPATASEAARADQASARHHRTAAGGDDERNGTYVLHPAGYEFQKWRSNSYSLLPGQNYVDIYVAVTLRNPRTGVVGGTWNHTWVITRDHSSYYVCGYL